MNCLSLPNQNRSSAFLGGFVGMCASYVRPKCKESAWPFDRGLMESQVIKTKFTRQDDDGSSGLKTKHFPDGSALIVVEGAVILVETTAPYEVNSPGQEPEERYDLLPPSAGQ